MCYFKTDHPIPQSQVKKDAIQLSISNIGGESNACQIQLGAVGYFKGPTQKTLTLLLAKLRKE